MYELLRVRHSCQTIAERKNSHTLHIKGTSHLEQYDIIYNVALIFAYRWMSKFHSLNIKKVKVKCEQILHEIAAGMILVTVNEYIMKV